MLLQKEVLIPFTVLILCYSFLSTRCFTVYENDQCICIFNNPAWIMILLSKGLIRAARRTYLAQFFKEITWGSPKSRIIWREFALNNFAVVENFSSSTAQEDSSCTLIQNNSLFFFLILLLFFFWYGYYALTLLE